MRLPRTLPAVLLLLLALGPAPARGELPAGRRPPTLAALDVWNAESFSLEGLRGRAVWLVFLSTTCPHCQAYTARLNALYASRSAAGLRVVGACRESPERIAAFVRDFRLRVPVIRVETEAIRDFDVPGYPAAFLLAANGRILWSGDPAPLDDARFGELLREARAWPAVPACLDWATREVGLGRFASARQGLLACAASGAACDDAGRAAAPALVAWLDGYAQSLVAAAEEDLAARRPADAWADLDHVARAFAGTDAGARAAELTARIRADVASSREVDAWALYEEARAVLRREGDAAARVALERLVAAHPSTEAGRRAAALAARLRRIGRDGSVK